MALFDWLKKLKDDFSNPQTTAGQFFNPETAKQNFENIGSQIVKSAKETPATPFMSAEQFSSADALNFGKSILQGVAKSGARVALSAYDIATGNKTDPTALKVDPEASALEKTFFKTVFGTDNIPGFATSVAKKELEYPNLTKLPGGVPAIAIGATALDFTGIGGERKGMVELLTKLDDPIRIGRVLEKIGVPAEAIKTYAEGFAKAKTKSEVEMGLKALEKFIKPSEIGPAVEQGGKDLAEEGQSILQSGIKRTEPVSVPPRPDIAPLENVESSLNGSIPSIEPTVKERGFIESMRESDKVPEETKRLIEQIPAQQRYYDVYTDQAAVTKAQEMIAAGHDEALNYVLSAKAVDKDVVTTGLELMRRYREAGNTSMEVELAANLAEKATKAGQGVQAFSILNNLSPEGVLVYANKRIRGAVGADKIAYLEAETKRLAEALKKAASEAADTAAKDVATEQKLFDLPEVKKIIPEAGKDIMADPKMLKTMPEDLLTPAERLAKRVSVTEKGAKKPDPVKDMVDTLYKIAQEVLPAKKKAVPRNQIELIGQAIRDQEGYKEVWAKAQEIVKTKYADDPAALATLDDYFSKILDRPFAAKQVESSVSKGIKEMEVKLQSLVREHFSKVAAARGDLTEKLISEAEIPAEKAGPLADAIEKRFDDLVRTKKETVLKAMFRDAPAKSDKTLIDRIIETSNLGGFESEKIKPLIAQKLGIPQLSESLAKKLVAQAEKIQSLEFGYDKYKATQELADMINREVPMSLKSKIWDLTQEVMNVPRALMASMVDFSGSFRQLIALAYRHPQDFGRAFMSQFKPFLNEGNYEAAMDAVMKHPKFQLASQSGVAFSDINAKLTLREERYMSRLAEKIPGLGKLVRATDRSFTALVNKARMDTFATLTDSFEEAGVALDKNTLSNISSLVNDMTGRGDIPEAIKGIQGLLNSFFFSPRLIASRINLLNPVGLGNGYILQSKAIRVEYLKTMAAFFGGTATVLGMAKVAGVEVGLDPRSADFAKIKIGNTRYDIMGSFQQYLRMAAQLWTGKYISSTTGKITTLGEGYKPLTRKDILLKQVESKEAPIFSFISTMLEGQDAKGNKINYPKEIVSRLTGMLISDMYDLYKDNPNIEKLIGSGFLDMLGVGVQTYAQPPAYQKLNEIKASADPAAAWADLQKNNKTLAKEVERAGIESTFNEFDWGLTYMGVKNGVRAQFLYQQMKDKTPEEQTQMYNDLQQKKLISPEVADQLNWLFQNPDYKPK